MLNKIKNFFGLKVKTEIDSAYNSASYIRKSLRKWYTVAADANKDFSSETQKTLRDRCRDAYRNYALARSAVNRVCLNSINVGLKLQSRLNFEKLGITHEKAIEYERLIEERFNNWCKHCDIEDSLNFGEMQYLLLASMLISGDVFVNTLFVNNKLRLQAIEGDRVCNPNFEMDNSKLMRGVQFGQYGNPIYYHIMTKHPNSDLMDMEYKWKKYSIYGEYTGLKRLFHIWNKAGEGRPGLVRGVPFLAPVLESLRQLELYSEAELTAAVISGYFSVFVKTESPQGLPSTMTQSTYEEENNQISLAPGAIVNLLPGESIDTSNPTRPNSNYGEFVKDIAIQIGSALGIPYEVLIQHFTSSYTAARGALLQAWALFKNYRQLIVNQFCQPIFELWLEHQIQIGELDILEYAEKKHLFQEATWIGNAQGSIDPTKDINAAKERINLGVSTIQKEAEEISNMDWLDINNQRKIEVETRLKSGLQDENSNTSNINNIDKTIDEKIINKLEENANSLEGDEK